MKKQTNDRFQGFANSLSSRLERLCAGPSENRFDAWLRKRFYPVLAVCHVIPFGVDEKNYKQWLSELLEGEPETEYDTWLRDRFYSIVAGFKVPDSCGWKSVVALNGDEFQE